MMAGEVPMTRDQREIHRKKRVLEYAERIGYTNKASRYFGVSRSSFYEWRDRHHGIRDDRIEKTSRASGEKIESQEGAPAQNVLDVVTQNPEEVHVAEQMSRVQMEKLRCQQ
jgi:ACT domain-containing protein